MVKLRNKKNGLIGHSGKFNMSSLTEIMILFEDGEMDTDYQSNWDVALPDGSWKDLGQAFRDHDVITDNYNTIFFHPRTPEDRERGFTL
jgi:hypothetical protein